MQPTQIQPRLPVKNLPGSLAFYQKLFEGKLDVASHEDFAILHTGGIGLQLVTASSAHPAGKFTIWIDSQGVAEFHERIKSDFEIEWGPEVYSYGRLEFSVLDPDGHSIIFSEPC